MQSWFNIMSILDAENLTTDNQRSLCNVSVHYISDQVKHDWKFCFFASISKLCQVKRIKSKIANLSAALRGEVFSVPSQRIEVWAVEGNHARDLVKDNAFFKENVVMEITAVCSTFWPVYLYLWEFNMSKVSKDKLGSL